jgi:hypothetical protein
MRGAILLNGAEVLRRRSRWCRGAVAALFVASAAAQADEAAWRDLESRIQYAYYTEDAAQLRALPPVVAATDSADRLHGYYAALLAWREALLAAERSAPDTADAGPLAARCVRTLDETLAIDPDFAEALALRAACLDAGGGRVSFAGHRARRDLDRALALAGHDPRVLLIDAMSDYRGASARTADRERALAKLRRAVAAFEAERGGNERIPGWGAAEAWMLLGRDLLEHGDSVAARDALEHALLIAPQFAQARRLMAKITAG